MDPASTASSKANAGSCTCVPLSGSSCAKCCCSGPALSFIITDGGNSTRKLGRTSSFKAQALCGLLACLCCCGGQACEVCAPQMPDGGGSEGVVA